MTSRSAVRCSNFIRTLVAIILTAVVPLHAASAQTKITIGYAAVSPRTTPLYIAQEQGIFSKYGLDAKVVLFRGAPTLVASLVSGGIEVGETGATSMVGAAAEATDCTLVSVH